MTEVVAAYVLSGYSLSHSLSFLKTWVNFLFLDFYFSVVFILLGFLVFVFFPCFLMGGRGEKCMVLITHVKIRSPLAMPF